MQKQKNEETIKLATDVLPNSQISVEGSIRLEDDDFECIVDPKSLPPIDMNKFSCPSALADAGACPGLA
jgi:hypothetical protein